MTNRRLQLASTATLIDGELHDATLTIDDGIVTRIDRERATIASDGADVVNVGARVVAPAPLDLHIHGAGGIVVPPVGSCVELDAYLDGVARAHGWCTPPIESSYQYVATLPVPTRPAAEPVSHIADAARAIARSEQCIGLRVEGLFLSPTRAGVWPPETFVAPDIALADRLIDAAEQAGSRLLIIDVAPELPGACELIRHLVGRSVVASLAHTDATWEQAAAAIDAGATMATHVFNAMRGLHHRDPGVVAASLADERVTCEVICDEQHVHPGIIDLVAATGDWCMISDASPFAGLGAGSWQWSGVDVHGDGTVLRDERGALAGSAMTLAHMIAAAARRGMPAQQIAIACAARPRRVLDRTRQLGLMVGDRPWVVPTID